jgi:hypothetical protein
MALPVSLLGLWLDPHWHGGKANNGVACTCRLLRVYDDCVERKSVRRWAFYVIVADERRGRGKRFSNCIGIQLFLTLTSNCDDKLHLYCYDCVGRHRAV